MNFKVFNRPGRSAGPTAQPGSGRTPGPVIATRSQAAVTVEAIELPTRRSATSAPGLPAASIHRFGKQQTLDKLARILDRGKNAAFVAGVGRYETTTAITPLRSTVNSAVPKLKSTVRGEGMPEWTLPQGVADAMARRPQGLSPEDILYRQSRYRGRRRRRRSRRGRQIGARRQGGKNESSTERPPTVQVPKQVL